jgi:hypothetical protein
MSESIRSPVGIAPDSEGQQTGFPGRVKRAARAIAGSRAPLRLTRFAGLLWPSRARSRREETTMRPSPAPTERQLRYLRVLATRTATTFVAPSTRRAASKEIERLLALSGSRDPAPPAEPTPAQPGEQEYATAVQSHEVSGFGSTATWRSQPPALRAWQDQRPVALLAYRVAGAERLLVAERRGGRVHVADVPGDGAGRRYEVEQLDSCEGALALEALASDYKARAEELEEIPMSAGALERTLNDG